MSVIYERARPSDYPDDFRLVRMDFKYMVAVEGSLTGFKVIRNSDNVTIFNAQDVGGLILSDKFLQLSAVLPTDRVFGLGEKRSKFMNDMNWNTFAIFNKDRAPAEDVGGLILSNKLLQLSAVLPTERVFGLGEKRSKFMNDINWNTFAIFNKDRAPAEGVSIDRARRGRSHHLRQLSAVLPTERVFCLGEKRSNFMNDINWNTFAIFNKDRAPAEGVSIERARRVRSHPLRQLSAVLPTERVFGLGEKRSKFMNDINWNTFAIFNKDRAPAEDVGGLILSDKWLQLSAVLQTERVFGLGEKRSKFDYGDLNTTRKVWQSNRDAGIPFDVQWNDIDYMKDHNDFTYNTDKFAGLPEFVNQLHSDGMHYIIIIDPGIGASEKPGTYPPFDRGLQMNIFVKNSTNQPFIGQVWNTGHTAFPDFTHPNSTDYWVEMMTTFHKKVPFDGAWINLPYRPHIREPYLREHTLCMDAMHYAGPHIDIHNLYGIAESQATNLTFIISRATFLGSGQYTGHWSGDIQSKWHDMQMTIPELLTFSLFGIPMMGADICGFGGNTTPELCKRWMQLGAFYPFSRNHNADTSIVSQCLH
ncbi:Lysosomal alpha-glucosidase [Operophtera brumata]|uniref:Lysosomal alpha-glucosidase n=1 Tax=Operophtera brumata TaxID=104452 RepID=A0A0L7LT72_OPEBR|nr:Lysosomal alpha-glucosidase [Operophtera brumata]